MVVTNCRELPEPLTLAEAAAVLRISRRTIYSLEAAGKLKGARLTKRSARYRRDDVLALLGQSAAATPFRD